MVVCTLESGMPRPSSSVVNPEAAATRTAPSPSLLPVAAVPPAAPATATAERRQWKHRCLGNRCIPILRWRRSQKPSKPQQQQNQHVLEAPVQQQHHHQSTGLRPPKPIQQKLEHHLQLQQQLQLQHERLQQLLQKQDPQQQKYAKKQQLQRQQMRQDRRLLVLLGSVGTTGLPAPYTGGGSNSSSKSVSSETSHVSAGFNASTLGTPGCNSSHSNSRSNSRSSSTSSSGSGSSSSGGSQRPMSSPSGCSTAGLYSLESAKSLETLFPCSSSISSRRASHGLTTKSPIGCGGAAAVSTAGRGTSAGSRCGAADTTAATEDSLNALPSAATATTVGACTAAGGAASADQHASRDATSLSSRKTMVLPVLGLLAGGDDRIQPAAATAPANPAAEGKPATAARTTSLTGAAADATYEWEGPDLLGAPTYRNGWNRRMNLQQQQQQQQEQSRKQHHQPEPQEQQRSTLQGGQQREQMRNTGGCLSPLASGTPPPSPLHSVPSQAAAAAKAAASQARAVGTNASALNAVSSCTASTLLEPSAASRPASSATDRKSSKKQQQQQRTQLESELPALPLLGGLGAAPGRCGLSLPAGAPAKSENDSDQCKKHPSSSSPTIRGGQSITAAATAVVDACVGSAAVDACRAAAAGAAADKEVNSETSEEEGQQQFDRQQQQEKQIVGVARNELQTKVPSPPQQQDQQMEAERVEHSPTPPLKDEPQVPHLPQICSKDSYAGASSGSPAAATAAVELAAAVVDAAASTAADTIGPSAEALVSSVTQRLSSLLTTGPPGCSLRAPRREQQLKQQQRALKEQQGAGEHHEQQRAKQLNNLVLPNPHHSPLHHHQPHQTQEQQLHQKTMQEQRLGQREIQPLLLGQSVPPMPVPALQAGCMVQKVSACNLRHQEQQQQHELLLQRLWMPTPRASKTGAYATTRSESPRRLQRRFSAPSKYHQLHQQLWPLQEQHQQHALPAKQRIEMQRTFFGVHLSASAEAAAATAAGAAAAAAASRPLCGGSILPPPDPFVHERQQQQVKQQQAISEAHLPEPCQLQQVQPLCSPSVEAAATESPAAPTGDLWSPRESPQMVCGGTVLCAGPPRTPSPACAFSCQQQDGPASGRRSPAGQQAAEASRRALLLRKNSQASLLHICSAANQDQQPQQSPPQQPQQPQQQARWETGGTHDVALAAAAAATAAPATLRQNKLEPSGTSPTGVSSNSTNVTSDASSASSMHSALTPQLLHPSRRTPLPLQQPGADIPAPPGGAAAVAERPSTPVRAERLRKRLERLRDMGQLSRDTYPAAEVASLISGVRVEKDGPFPVYVLDKDWSLGCTALDPDWPQKMLQNTKEGIKLHSEINRLLALAKEVDIAQAKKEVQ